MGILEDNIEKIGGINHTVQFDEMGFSLGMLVSNSTSQLDNNRKKNLDNWGGIGYDTRQMTEEKK